MRYLTSTILYFCLQTITLASPIQNIQNFTAKYDVYHNGLYVGQSTRTLNSNNNSLSFSSVTETAGLAALFFNITIHETSQLRFKNNQLNFVSYHFEEKNNDKSERYQLSLIEKPAEKSRQLYNTHTKKHYPASDNLQDMLGFTITAMMDLKKGQRELNYTLADKDHVKPYHLKLKKEEKIATDSGEINTLKMEHYDPIKNIRFTLWCAEKLNFLPVKISQIKENGDETLLTLTELNSKKVYLNFDNEALD